MKAIFTYTMAIIVCLSLSFLAQAKEKKNELDGKTFVINLTETGKKTGRSWTRDEISFSSNMLKLKVMNEHEHFPSTKCTITIDSTASGKKISFTTKMKNWGTSKIILVGTISDNVIEGTAVYTNAQGPQSYSFTGTLKTK